MVESDLLVVLSNTACYGFCIRKVLSFFSPIPLGCFRTCILANYSSILKVSVTFKTICTLQNDDAKCG